MEHRLCKHCKIEKPIDEFKKDRRYTVTRCKSCSNLYESIRRNIKWRSPNELPSHLEYKRNHKLQNSEHNKTRNIRIKDTSDWTITKQSLESILIRQDYSCNLCGCNISSIKEKDHIIPLSKWWKHTITNIQFVCPKCNLKKASKTNPMS